MGNEPVIFKFKKLSERFGSDVDGELESFVTTRHGGVSEGSFSTWNLGEYGQDRPENLKRNKEILAEILGVVAEQIVTAKQIHGDEFKIIDDDFELWKGNNKERAKELKGFDGLITRKKGVCLAVMTADCVPMVFYESKMKVIGVVHAGWRSTVQKIGVKMIKTLVEKFNCRADEIWVGIGPAIGMGPFEVENDVFEEFKKADLLDDGLWREGRDKDGRANDKKHLDLVGINIKQLVKSGVEADKIDVTRICTFCESDDFFSYRKLGSPCGQFLTGVMLK